MAEKRPFRIVLGEGPQKGALGGSLSRYVPPGAQYDYNPPSVFERYKILSIVFALLLSASLLFLLLVRHHPRQPPAAPETAAATPASPATSTPGAASADTVYVMPVAPPESH